MTIVVDLGCAEYESYPEEVSIGPLLERFKPWMLIGFDPCCKADAWNTPWGCAATIPRAAWVRDGFVSLHRSEFKLRTFVSEPGEVTTPCFDLARLLSTFVSDRVVLKMDVEGAEYELIPHLIATHAWERVGTWLIEWHGDPIDDLPFQWEEWL